MTFLGNKCSFQQSPDSRLYQALQNRQFMLAGFICCLLAFAAPMANAVDATELTLATSLDLAFQNKQDAPAGSTSENNAAVRYGMGSSSPTSTQFELSLTLDDSLNIPISDKQDGTVQSLSYKKENDAATFHVASATPAQSELPLTLATGMSFPAPIERFIFFPSVEGMSVSMGMEYKTGKYGGSSRFDTTYMPLTAKYETRQWAFKLVIPHIEITESGTYVNSLGETVNYRVTHSGLGDIEAAANYYLYDNPDLTAGLDLTGKIKFGTADSQKWLGNGKDDYAIQINAYRTADKFTAFGTIGYKMLGQPSGVTLHNVFFGTLGAGYKYDQSTQVGVAMDQTQKPSELGAPQREFSVYFSHGYNKNWNIQGYVLKGFADGSPDIGGGAALMYKPAP